MNDRESVAYWDDRWKKQGMITVGHVGSTDEQQREQAHAYGTAIQSVVKRGAHVLEVGCGWGRLVPYIIEGGVASYDGVDIAAEAIRWAQGQEYSIQRYASFRTVPPGDLSCFPSGKFDTVVCCTVLQHITDDGLLVRTVTEIMRVLAPGGRIILLENVWDRPSKPHVAFRSPETYGALFAPVTLREVTRVTHRGEPHALLVGDRVV